MTYIEDPAYEPVLRRDLEAAEQRIANLESEVRTLKAEIASLGRTS